MTDPIDWEARARVYVMDAGDDWCVVGTIDDAGSHMLLVDYGRPVSVDVLASILQAEHEHHAAEHRSEVAAVADAEFAKALEKASEVYNDHLEDKLDAAYLAGAEAMRTIAADLAFNDWTDENADEIRALPLPTRPRGER